ncbi:hypothetical protein VPH35_063772 [Triticum aestivum]|nr:cysteine-rich receptor-like protein kinase 25 [Triticum aestivum]
MRIEGVSEYIYAEIRERLLCFEYISNGSLRGYITDELSRLEWNTRYQIIKQICHGLHYLHKEKTILHMDLKPDNILLDNNMVAKISDFGLSRLDEKSQTMDAKRCVTLGYCSPEYLLGGKMSVKSDMYSLGVMIIELVTGYKDIPDNNNVLRRWRHRWNKSQKETPWSYQILQITKCIGIGLHCQESDPYRRPFIQDIIHDMNGNEGTFGQNSNADGFYADQTRPCWDDDMLDIEPLKLHFQFELNKEISCLLNLDNSTTAAIAFAIQSVSPMPYCIQPNKGIVLPLSRCAIVITLESQSMPPKDMQHLGEFVVQSAKIIDGVTPEEITSDMFNKVSGEVVDEVNVDAIFELALLLEES